MPLIATCIEPGCSTKCIGLFCVAHDSPPAREFPRGRPWPGQSVAVATESAAHVAEPDETVLTPVRPAA
jgi:hypothetical protein